jgi:hypothetical protein
VEAALTRSPEPGAAKIIILAKIRDAEGAAPENKLRRIRTGFLNE